MKGLVRGGVGVGLLETTKPKSVTAGIRWRGRWGVIGFGRDEGELEVEIVEDAVVYASESLEFELEVSRSEPFKEGDFVIVQERPLEDVGDPLTLLCVRQWVIDVAGNGGLNVRYSMWRTCNHLGTSAPQVFH